MSRSRFKSFLCLSLLSCLAMLVSILPGWGGNKETDDQALKNAAKALKRMFKDDYFPLSLLAKADCVMVLPDVKRIGTAIGGSGGRGPMSCRTGKDFTGTWSIPAMYSVNVSVGPQFGDSTDYVLLIMNPKAVDALLNGKTKLDSYTTAGPTGAMATNWTKGDILTYGRSEGLFFGASMTNTSLEADNDANKRLYGKAVNARDIVVANAVTTTDGGLDFISALSGRLLSSGN